LKVLGNMRLLGLPSELMGKDWSELTIKIDEMTQQLGMELFEQSIYLIFDSSPGAVLEGLGTCFVARSVIGPKKSVNAPYVMADLEALSVYQHDLQGKDWSDVLKEAYIFWESLQRQTIKLDRQFILALHRRDKDGLSLESEVLFAVKSLVMLSGAM